jgi:hypothetical protein
MRLPVTFLVLAGSIAIAQTAGPQPGWVPAPRQGAPGAMSDAEIRKTVEAYRRLWQSMTPQQRQQTLRNGGFTPEQYEAMMRGTGPVAPTLTDAVGAPAKPAGAEAAQAPQSTALDSLGRTLLDLDTIRDVNTGRLQKDGCPPEVVSRMAELRGQLARLESDFNGAVAPASGVASTRRSSLTDPQDTAANWFHRGEIADPSPVASASSPDRLLDSVLPNPDTLHAAPVAADPGARRKSQEAAAAKIRAELAQLSGACAPGKK